MCRGGRNFPDHPENIGTIRKLSRLSENFPGYPETFRTIWKISRLSETFQLSGNFRDHPENIRTIRKISGISGNFPGYQETFQTIPKIFRLSGNFADSPQTSQYIFKGYAQKLSGRAKTFRMAMPRCHDGFCASGVCIDSMYVYHRFTDCTYRLKHRMNITWSVRYYWSR